MQYAEFVSVVAKSTGVDIKAVREVLADAAGRIGRQLSLGDEVSIPTLGTFSASYREARTGRNPRTGEPIQIAAKTVPTFAPAKALRDRLA